MAMKEWLQWLPPPRSLMALLIAITGFGGRMCAAYVTHSPTLLVDACHSLCRLVGLVTTLLAYKVLYNMNKIMSFKLLIHCNHVFLPSIAPITMLFQIKMARVS